MKEINRTPIILSKNTVALIQIFTRNDELEDTWSTDLEQWCVENYNQHGKAAKQFISQLKGKMCLLFMVALHNELAIHMESELINCHISYDEVLKDLEISK